MFKYTVRIDNDSDCSDPSKECNRWRIYSFHSNHLNHTDPSEFLTESGKFKFQIARKLQIGLAFPLSYYEHGLGLWSVGGTGPQCNFDTTQFAGMAVWEEPASEMGAKTIEDRQKDLAGELEDYTNWHNGNCYYIDITDNETGEDVERLGGMVGEDQAIDTLKEMLPDDATKENTEFVGDGVWMLNYCDVFAETPTCPV